MVFYHTYTIRLQYSIEAPHFNVTWTLWSYMVTDGLLTIHIWCLPVFMVSDVQHNTILKSGSLQFASTDLMVKLRSFATSPFAIQHMRYAVCRLATSHTHYFYAHAVGIETKAELRHVIAAPSRSLHLHPRLLRCFVVGKDEGNVQTIREP